MSKQIDRESDKPLYVQLKEIVHGQLPKGESLDLVRLPSERNLASEYGVSRMTARQALKSLGQELAIQRNGQGTFFDKKSTHSLDLIRFVFPNNWSTLSESAFYSNIFSGAEQRAHEYDCDLLFSTLGSDNKLLCKLRATDAIILVGETDKQRIRRIQEIGCKLCLIDCNVSANNLGWDQVVVDNSQASELAADVFHHHKHTKCAFIDSYSKAKSFAFKLRHKAFASRLKDHGLNHARKDSFEMDWDSIEDNTERILNQLIDKGYTAAYAAHSHFAVDLLETARKHKLEDKISLIGFADDTLCRKAALNTISVPEQLIGETAIEQIIKSHNNGWCLKQNALISTHYVDRGSVKTV